VPEFLEVMVGFLRGEGHRAAYSASELRSEDRVEYRGRPLHREALRERNYIDCITLVHERALIDEVGGFDESLRRVVDWDLLIRLAEVTDLAYAPFVGTSYDLWDERGDRITLHESVGYRHVVRHKHLVDLSAAPAIRARAYLGADGRARGRPDPLPVLESLLRERGRRSSRSS
jgi:O-antigen biosynthesis protein